MTFGELLSFSGPHLTANVGELVARLVDALTSSTVILIMHRPENLALTDRTVTLDGRIMETAA